MYIHNFAQLQTLSSSTFLGPDLRIQILKGSDVLFLVGHKLKNIVLGASDFPQYLVSCSINA